MLHFYMVIRGFAKEETKKEVVVEAEQKSHINFTEYVLEHDIHELADLEVEIENQAITVSMKNQTTVENYKNLGSTIYNYGMTISTYPIFSEMGEYIIKLGNTLIESAELLQADKEKCSQISVLLEAFVNDLMLWRKEVFINNSAEPDFLNASFFSNVTTIISFITSNESDKTEADEIEFF